MPFSSLQYLTVVQLKAIAKDMNISFQNNIKKAELINLLSKVLPEDFDVAQYVRIDVLSNIENLHSINKKNAAKENEPTLFEYAQSHDLAVQAVPQEIPATAPVPNESPAEAYESALFDVTNYEPTRKTPAASSNKSSTASPVSQKPGRYGSNYGRHRFGPSTAAPPPPMESSIYAQTPPAELKGEDNKVFKQAYTARSLRPQEHANARQQNTEVLQTAPSYNISQEPIALRSPESLLHHEQEIPVNNYLEILPSGYGFLRDKTFLTSPNDAYVSNGIIQRYRLRRGDLIEGVALRSNADLKYPALAYVTRINQIPIEHFNARVKFDELTPSYPTQKIQLENKDGSTSITNRLIDFVSPIHFGHRALILAPPTTGATSVLCDLANAIQANNDAEVLFVSIDSTPEEITLIESTVHCKIYSAAFDKNCEEQMKVCEMALEYAKRASETGSNVVLLLDSFSRLINLCQASLVQNAAAHTFAPQALNRAKQVFSTARNTQEAGSVTLITSMNYNTGNKLDNLLADKFIEKANATIFLDKDLSNRYLFPAINLKLSALKRPDIILPPDEIEIYKKIHQVFNIISSKQAITQFIDLIMKTKNNHDLRQKLPEWLDIWEKLSMV